MVNAYTYAALLRFAEMARVAGGHDAEAAAAEAAAAAMRVSMNQLLYDDGAPTMPDAPPLFSHELH